jgi:RNA polymerase sigma-70 factor (ECF subfamily)
MTLSCKSYEKSCKSEFRLFLTLSSLPCSSDFLSFSACYTSKTVEPDERNFVDFSTLDDASLLEMIAISFGKLDAEPILNEALGALYDRYARLVFSVALRLVGDVETSEEITQDVFVRVCEGAHGYREQLARVSTWLVSIARHRAIDELRRRGVRPEQALVDWLDEEGQERRDGLPTKESPEREIETSLQEQAIRQMVADLPADQRQVLGLAYFKGMSHSQIAATLGEPLGTVKSRFRLAMQRLRDALQDYEMMETT